MDTHSTPEQTGGTAPMDPALASLPPAPPSDAMRRALDRERAARKEAERLLEDKSRELYAKSEELRELNAGLESKVAERTAELAQALASAQAGVRAKDEFLTNMSHEVRTPMTSILGYAEMLLEPGLTPTQVVEYVGVIRRHGEQLMGTIDHILELSRLAAGDAKAETAPFNPTELITSAMSPWSSDAQAKGLTLGFVAESELPPVLVADAGRVRAMLSDLLSNALRFTVTGGIRVSTRVAEGTPMRLRITVTDTGPGIEPSKQAAIFQPFVQSDSSLTRRHGGVGLGLTVARRTAEFLGGSITLQSEPGKGSSFTIEIPVERGEPTAGAAGATASPATANQPAAAGAPATTPTNAAAATAPLPDLTGLRILIAEDTEDSRVLLQARLEMAGAEVACAVNGEEAMEAALTAAEHRRAFTLIIMDMQMPVLSGYEASALLRRNGYRGPIVALTAHTLSHDRARCIAAGCNEYLTKPVDFDRLIRLCDRLARRTVGHGPASSARAA